MWSSLPLTLWSSCLSLLRLWASPPIPGREFCFALFCHMTHQENKGLQAETGQCKRVYRFPPETLKLRRERGPERKDWLVWGRFLQVGGPSKGHITLVLEITALQSSRSLCGYVSKVPHCFLKTHTCPSVGGLSSDALCNAAPHSYRWWLVTHVSE